MAHRDAGESGSPWVASQAAREHGGGRSPRLRTLVSALLCIFVAAGNAVAQPAPDRPLTRRIVPVPFNDNTPVAVGVSLDQREPRIGSTVAICFQASRAGFATLWNISTGNEVTRIFPNPYQTSVAATRVDANRRNCAGVSGDPFRFRVDGPPGTEDLYLLWTARPDLQPSGSAYRDADALVSDMQRLGGANAADWATAKVTYDVVPATGPVPPALPPQEVTGSAAPPAQAVPAARPTKVFVLAMGANVGQLTKANQDASMFVDAIAGLFNAKPDDVHLVANATKADFRAGMQWLRGRAQPNDFIFIYFSGHGGRFRNPSSDDGWDEYLVPYDFETSSDPRNAVLSQELAAWINDIPSKNVIATVDACHSAGVFRSLEANTLGARSKFYALPPEASAALTEAAASPPVTRSAGGRNRVKANGILLAAAHRDQAALEGPRGSHFTLALVQELMSKKGGTLADVFARSAEVTQSVTDHRQTPEAVGDVNVARHVVMTP